MQVVHEADSERRVLATDVETADTLLSQARGLMFRKSFPPGSALAFRFSRPRRRDVHMLFVRFPIDVVWTVEETVTRVERLHPWRGFALGRADVLFEFPAGTAEDVAEGDVVRLVE